jgi:hypothetical protein
VGARRPAAAGRDSDRRCRVSRTGQQVGRDTGKGPAARRHHHVETRPHVSLGAGCHASALQHRKM